MNLNDPNMLLSLESAFDIAKSKISACYTEDGGVGARGATSILVVVPNREYASVVASMGVTQTLLQDAQAGDEWWFSGPLKARLELLLAVRYDGKTDLLSSSALKQLVSRIPAMLARSSQSPVVVLATPGNAFKLLTADVAPALGVVISVYNEPEVLLHLGALVATGTSPRDLLAVRALEAPQPDQLAPERPEDYDPPAGVGPMSHTALHLMSPGPRWFKAGCLLFALAVFGGWAVFSCIRAFHF